MVFCCCRDLKCPGCNIFRNLTGVGGEGGGGLRMPRVEKFSGRGRLLETLE